MGYVDDTAAAAAAHPREVAKETQALADTLRGLVHALGQRNHSGKMKMLGYRVQDGEVIVHRFSIQWGTDNLVTQPRHTFIKLLGGNANITGGFAQIKRDIKRWTNKVTAQLSRLLVSAGVAVAVIEGVVENRMVFKGIVNIPSDG